MAFKPGCKAATKGKNPVYVVIKATLGTKSWKCHVVDEQTGQETDTVMELRSQQMRNLKPGETFPGGPPQENPDSTNQGDQQDILTEEQEETVEAVPPAPSTGSRSSQASVVDDSESRPSNNGNGTDQSLSVDSLDTPRPDTEQPNDLSEEEEGDPDDEEEEDIPISPDAFENERADFNASDFAAARGIEQDDDKHKAKWQQYLTEKDSLIKNEWTVARPAPNKQKIDVGERVTERTGQKRVGVVLDSVESDRSKKWSVQFEDGTTEEVSSTGIKLVRDERVFTWKIVQDSTPDDPVTVSTQCGVAGFKFDVFADAEEKSEDADYKFPFLMLLIHMWPGDWRDHLSRLNRFIGEENAKVPMRQQNKKSMSLVSGACSLILPSVLL